MDSRGGYVSKILYVETKESGPLGGRALGTPPRSANVYCVTKLADLVRTIYFCQYGLVLCLYVPSVADQGFPAVGGANFVRGRRLRCDYVSKISAKSTAILTVNTSMWHDMTSRGYAPYGHSKVVLSSGILGTVLPR